MVIPALIIGLGGTGVKALTYAKQDFMRNNNGQVPPEVKFLAFDTTTKPEDWWNNLEVVTEDGRLLPVRLEQTKNEYVHIGGNCKKFVQATRDEKNGQVATWLQYQWMLDNLSDAKFNIEEGAGQMRQMGRLAIFYDLVQGANSKIRSNLQKAVNDVANHAGGRQIQVFIVGSVAGGTGSGMFIDLAYLVRKLAKNKPIVCRGFVVLPSAFGGEPNFNGNIPPTMKGQGYAALREIDRFMEDFKTPGYPMFYLSPNPGPPEDTFQGMYQSKLFDMVYVVDGNRATNDLAYTKLVDGVAPTMGELIAAYLDPAGANVFDQHEINVAGYSTVGTYTKILPINEIIDKFAHQVAYETLQTLFPAAEGRITKEGGREIPQQLSDQANQLEVQSGGKHVFDFLGKSSVTSYREAEWQAGATSLFADIGKIGQTVQDKGPVAAQIILKGRTLEQWLTIYTPAYDTFETQRKQVDHKIKQKITEVVSPSKEVPNEKPCDGMLRIEKAIINYKNKFLGSEKDSSRRRAGGEFKENLQAYHQEHLRAFREMVTIETENLLNSGSADKVQALGGKLGYVRAFLTTLEQTLEGYQQQLTDLENDQSIQNRRQSLYATAETKKKTMKDDRNSWVPGRPVNRQVEYLKAEQALIQFLMEDIVRQMIRETVGQMEAYVKQANQVIEAWVKQLAEGPDSLFAQVARRLQKLEDKKITDSVKVQEVIRDENYENQLFQTYCTPQQQQQFLGALRWHITRPEQDDESPQFQLTFEVQEQALALPTEYADKDYTARLKQENQELFLQGARRTFQAIWQNESILKYLTTHCPGQETRLGQEFVSQGGTLMLVTGVDQTRKRNYLRAKYNASGQFYLDKALTAAAGQSGLANTQFASLIRSEDKFKLSFIYIKDGYLLDDISEHQNAFPAYLGWQGTIEDDSREKRLPPEVLHIFPAEVNANRFERRAQEELHQDRNQLGPFKESVIKLLERTDRFERFAQCYLIGLINNRPDPADPTRIGWRLDLPVVPSRGDFDSTLPETKIYLTIPKTGEASLLDACHTFSYLEKDVQNGAIVIDYERCKQAVTQALQDMLDRATELKLEERHTRLINKLPDEELQKTVKYLFLSKNFIVAQSQQKVGRYLQPMPNQSDELFDLYTIMSLVLQDWAKARYESGIDLVKPYQ